MTFVLTLAKRVLASRWIRYGFIAAALAFGVYYVVGQWHDIHHALDRIGLAASLLALLSVLFALVCSMLSWRALLAGLGSRLPFLTASRVLFVGQLGKYLPGSVWPILAQMELAAEHKVPRHRTGAVSLITMGISVLCGLLVGLVALPFTGGIGQYWWAFIVAVPMAACVYPPVLNRLLGFGFKILRRPSLEKPMTGRAVAASVGWSVLSWIFYGVQIWILMVQSGAHETSAFPLAIGTFAFAMAIGIIVIPVPAGAGLREVLIVAMLTPMVGPASATAITLVSRIVTVLGDGVVAGLAIVSYRLGSRGRTVVADEGPASGLVDEEAGSSARRVAP